MFIHIRIYTMGVSLWNCMYNCMRDKQPQDGSFGGHFFQNDNKYDIHTYILFSMTQE